MDTHSDGGIQLGWWALSIPVFALGSLTVVSVSILLDLTAGQIGNLKHPIQPAVVWTVVSSVLLGHAVFLLFSRWIWFHNWGVKVIGFRPPVWITLLSGAYIAGGLAAFVTFVTE